MLKVVPQLYEGISGSDKIKISFPLINVLSTFKPCNKLKIFKIPKYHSFLSKCGDVLVARGKRGKGGFGRFKFLRRSPTPPMVGLPLTLAICSRLKFRRFIEYLILSLEKTSRVRSVGSLSDQLLVLKLRFYFEINYRFTNVNQLRQKTGSSLKKFLLYINYQKGTLKN